MKNYVVLRIANKADGTFNAPVQGFESESAAWKEFFRLCGAAVDSTHLVDSVVIMSKEGFELDHRVFLHGTEPEPETGTTDN